MSKSAREIKLNKEVIKNPNIKKISIGTSENRDSPETVYINIGFWVKPKVEMNNVRSFLQKKLNSSIDKIKYELSKEDLFPFPDKNIFIINLPDNIAYNNKRNFISIDMYIHTCNRKNIKKIPLNKKKNTILFDKCLDITNKLITQSLFKSEEEFMIFSKS